MTMKVGTFSLYRIYRSYWERENINNNDNNVGLRNKNVSNKKNDDRRNAVGTDYFWDYTVVYMYAFWRDWLLRFTRH